MSNVPSSLRNFGKRFLRLVFEAGQRLGIDLLPRHFYSEIPDIYRLKHDESWKQARTMIGVEGIDEESQFAFVAECCTPGLIDRISRGDIYESACKKNREPGFGPIEADFLHAFISTIRPKRIIQVGCGVSTAVIIGASEEIGHSLQITCIEPFPNKFLIEMNSLKKISLINEIAQNIPLEKFVSLEDNDLLFVDSSHSVGPGSEVNKIILEILPRLSSGVWVHFHDIKFPFDYQRGLLDEDLFFQNESTLLHAYLIGNKSCSIKVSFSMLHYANPKKLKTFLPLYQPAYNDFGLRASNDHFPSSTYLRIVNAN